MSKSERIYKAILNLEIQLEHALSQNERDDIADRIANLYLAIRRSELS